MKKIIVPTDFSKSAESAANYAAWLAQKLSAKVELVHVIGMTISENSLRNWKTMEKQLVEAANQQAVALMETIRNPVEITYKHLNGSSVEDEISRYAVETDADLVVIGSRGASGFKKALFGSNAVNLINKCPKPVIVVPGGAEFNGIKKIVYATDMIHLDEEIKTVARFAKPFDSEVTIVHITDENARKRDRSDFKEILARMADYKKIDFKVIGNDDIIEGIESESKSIDADLLVMFTHERDIIDRMMGLGITRQLAFQNSRPLMVINRSFRE